MVLAFVFLTAQLSVPALGRPSPATIGEALQSTPRFTLSAAVAAARTTSPRRRPATLVAESAREAALSAAPFLNPYFELRTENWSSSSATSAPALDVFAIVTQPFELGGKREARRQLAISESEVAATSLKALERTLALDTVRVYVRALKARALVETLTGNRDGLSMLVASVTRRVDEGYSAEADLLKFKTEAARVDGDIARAQLELERSLTALSIVIGATTPIQASQLIEPPRLPVPTADAALVAASVARHPDTIASTAVVERARQGTALERARHYPDPAITGGYKRTAGFDTLVLGVSLAVPIFDRNTSAVARSFGAERGAIAEREALVQQLTTDAMSLIRAAETISAQADKAPQDLLEPAEIVRSSALAAFREGTADVLKLIDAERVYADVNRAAIDLRLDALLTTIEARFALGEEAIP